MSLEDPFFVVKADVQKSLQTSRGLYSRWCELLDDSSTTGKEEYEWTVTELKNSLRSIDWDLEDLAETIAIVGKNQKKFKISDEELKERQTFVERMRATIQDMRNHMNSAEVRAKEEQKSKQVVTEWSLRDNNKGGNTADRYDRLNKDIEQNNQNIIDSTHQQQQMVMNEQDEQLTRIGTSVTVLKHMSHNIGNEMDEQNRMLDDFSHEMDHTDTKMDSVMKKMAKVMHMSSDKRQWCVIIALIVVMVIVITLFFVL